MRIEKLFYIHQDLYKLNTWKDRLKMKICLHVTLAQFILLSKLIFSFNIFQWARLSSGSVDKVLDTGKRCRSYGTRSGSGFAILVQFINWPCRRGPGVRWRPWGRGSWRPPPPPLATPCSPLPCASQQGSPPRKNEINSKTLPGG